ncbi:MAG: hypothetical protein IJN54_17005 [Lachnospiraceae bacterium]|nr:hypothetical protein [Lachnospiraceae bacterium]
MNTNEPIDSMSKQEIVDVLYRAANIIQRFDAIDRELERAEARYEKKEAGGYKKPWHGMKPFWKKILILFVSVALVLELDDSFNKLAVVLFDVWGLSANMSVFLVKALQFMIIILILVLAQTLANKWIIKRNKEIAGGVEYKRVQKVQTELDAVVDEYAQIYRIHIDRMKRLPDAYRFEKKAFLFMAKAIEQGRAETFEEAVKLYERKYKYRKL